MTEQNNNAAAQEETTQFALQRIYVKDLSLKHQKAQRFSVKTGALILSWT